MKPRVAGVLTAVGLCAGLFVWAAIDVGLMAAALWFGASFLACFVAVWGIGAAIFNDWWPFRHL